MTYGATGTGKTYTMLGTADQPGIVIRCLSDLYNSVEKDDRINAKIKISYIEIYNETIRDLLDDSNELLQLREDPSKGVTIIGVKEIVAKAAVEVFKAIV